MSDVEDAEPEAEEQTVGEALATVQLRREKLKLKQRKQYMRQREKVAEWALQLVTAQLVISNSAFILYLLWNEGRIEAPVMITWLTTSVAEVVGIVWVIARNLFPYRDKTPPRGKKDDGLASA